MSRRKKPPDYITRAEATAEFGIAAPTLSRAVKRGALTEHEVGITARRLKRSEVAAFVKRTGGRRGRPKSA